MKIKNRIFVGSTLMLALALQAALPVGAVKVPVGDGVEFDSDAHVVSSVDCVVLDDGNSAESAMRYRTVGDNTGARQTATVSYAKVEGDSLLTEAWCKAQEEKTIADLSTANVAMYSGMGERNLVDFAAVEGGGACDNSILTWIDCEGGDGVGQLLSLVVNIMTAGIVILTIVGVTVSGVQWMTARDNESQVVKAKSRLFNIVIGVVVWGLMWLVMNWLLPGGLL